MENKYTIFYKNETDLIDKFCQEFNCELYANPTFGQKWGLGKDLKSPDIYFHTGVVKNSDIQLMSKSSKIIVNSKTIKKTIIEKTKSKSLFIILIIRNYF